MSLFHEGKKLKTRVRLTSHNVVENRELSRTHGGLRKETANGRRRKR